MKAINRRVIFLSISLSPLFSYAEKMPEITCSPNGDCTFSAEHHFCPPNLLSNIRLDLDSNTYLIMCECNCTSQDNYGWIARRSSTQLYIQEVLASKIIRRSDIIAFNNQIPDLFGPTPLCETLDAATELVILDKVPSPGLNPSPPYCYRASRLNAELVNCHSASCNEVRKKLDALDTDSEQVILQAFLGQTKTLAATPGGLKHFPRSAFIRARIEQKSLKANQQILNDIAYYWQQAGYHREAIWLLEKILEAEPNRTVAHLNLADSLWSEGNSTKAKEHYLIYIQSMRARKKDSLIPARAFNRSQDTHKSSP
ncbi:bacterial transcriptional activator domain-containing protein [Metapseudomonas otitidis]|uniref:bacterial transcriptional activator domain-containing protein n=1 Tax=Metapseudomonas otitidis TaxID=319939 RepID=UPI0032162D6D